MHSIVKNIKDRYEFVNIAKIVYDAMKINDLSEEDIDFITVNFQNDYVLRAFDEDRSFDHEYLIENHTHFLKLLRSIPQACDDAISFTIVFRDGSRLVYEPDDEYYTNSIRFVRRIQKPEKSINPNILLRDRTKQEISNLIDTKIEENIPREISDPELIMQIKQEIRRNVLSELKFSEDDLSLSGY